MAAGIAPDAAPILLKLAQLLQNQGNMDQAGTYLNRLVGRGDLTELERRQASSLLARAGQLDRAIAVMESAGAAGQDDTSRLVLAGLYAQRGNAEKAGALLDVLMEHPTLAVIRMAANFYASHNRLADAEKAIAQLQTLKLDPAVVATEQGDFASRFGKSQDAIDAYTAGLKAAPGNAQIWYRLIGFHLQSGSIKETLAAIDQAAAAVPGDKTLALLQSKKSYIETLGPDPRCRPVLLSLLNAPQEADAAEVVLARLQQSKGTAAPDPQLVIDLNRLADRYPQYAALQSLAVELDVLSGRIDDAVNIATRAMQTFPTAAEPARLAASAFAASNRWAEMLNASTQWRNRSPDQPMAPDVMIGLSYLGMGRPDDTLKQIEPYMANAAADPDAYGSVIALYARSELAKNHPANAEAKLWPLAKSSKRGMITFLQIAGHDAPVPVGRKWLDMGRAELHSDMDLVFVYATAANELAVRAHDPAIISSTIDEMTRIVTTAKGDPIQLSMGYLAVGMLNEGRKSSDAAEAAYRHAVALNPNSDVACNNLAMVLARRGALNEALTLAGRAASMSPKVAAFQDTLAFVKDKSGDHAGAIENLRAAIQLQPANMEWRVNLAQIYVNAGQPDKARSMLANSDGTPIRADGLQPDVRDRLSSLNDKLGIKL
jgi:tetratricopeptide (TPR) repeat protein